MSADATTRPLTREQARTITEAIMTAIEYAHAAGHARGAAQGATDSDMPLWSTYLTIQAESDEAYEYALATVWDLVNYAGVTS